MMDTNLIKVYNDLLEIVHLSPNERIQSLRAIFNRDIYDNENFQFRKKIIRPLKVDGVADMETLFGHLTCSSEDIENKDGKKYKKRIFEMERSQRLHWIWHHIQEKNKDKIDVFSYCDRIKGKDQIRTYIYDFVEKYVIILEPHRSRLDYYLLTAYHLTKKKGGIKQIDKKRKKKLDIVY